MSVICSHFPRVEIILISMAYLLVFPVHRTYFIARFERKLSVWSCSTPVKSLYKDRSCFWCCHYLPRSHHTRTPVKSLYKDRSCFLVLPLFTPFPPHPINQGGAVVLISWRMQYCCNKTWTTWEDSMRNNVHIPLTASAIYQHIFLLYGVKNVLLDFDIILSSMQSSI